MATIFINELKIPAVIGVFSWEKKVTQTLIFDLEFDIDIAHVAKNDDINDAVDYVKVCSTIQNFLQNKHFNLIETLADEVAHLLTQTFSLATLRLVVKKPKVLANVKEVGVIIQKSGE